MKNNTFSSRFKGASWYNPGTAVTIGGAGGIGSYLSFFLARQECKIFLYDHDYVEGHNLGGQLYGKNDIGINKAIACSKMCSDLSGNKEITCMGKFESQSMITDIAFSAFDNMQARKLMFEKWKLSPGRHIFIDGRMSFEVGEIYAVTKKNEDKYISTLFKDEAVKNELCTIKATSHCGAMTASYMVAVFNNYLSNFLKKNEAREVPFCITFQLPMIMQTVLI